MRDNLSAVFQEIRKDFDAIDPDEYCELLDDVINTGIYRPVMTSITDIMMCFEKRMMETTHRLPFMSEREKEEVLINTIKEHLVLSPP